MKKPLMAPANKPANKDTKMNCHIFSGEPSKPTRVASTVFTIETTPPTEISIPPPRMTIACPTDRRMIGRKTRILLLSVSLANMFGCRIKLIISDNTSKTSANKAGWRAVRTSHRGRLTQYLPHASRPQRPGFLQLDSLSLASCQIVLCGSCHHGGLKPCHIIRSVLHHRYYIE